MIYHGKPLEYITPNQPRDQKVSSWLGNQSPIRNGNLNLMGISTIYKKVFLRWLMSDVIMMS